MQKLLVKKFMWLFWHMQIRFSVYSWLWAYCYTTRVNTNSTGYTALATSETRPMDDSLGWSNYTTIQLPGGPHCRKMRDSAQLSAYYSTTPRSGAWEPPLELHVTYAFALSQGSQKIAARIVHQCSDSAARNNAIPCIQVRHTHLLERKELVFATFSCTLIKSKNVGDRLEANTSSGHKKLMIHKKSWKYDLHNFKKAFIWSLTLLLRCCFVK